MPTVQEVWKDPDFLRLPPPEKTKVMQAIDADFAGLPTIEQNKVVMQLSGGKPAAPATSPETAGEGQYFGFAQGSPEHRKATEQFIRSQAKPDFAQTTVRSLPLSGRIADAALGIYNDPMYPARTVDKLQNWKSQPTTLRAMAAGAERLSNDPNTAMTNIAYALPDLAAGAYRAATSPEQGSLSKFAKDTVKGVLAPTGLVDLAKGDLNMPEARQAWENDALGSGLMAYGALRGGIAAKNTASNAIGGAIEKARAIKPEVLDSNISAQYQKAIRPSVSGTAGNYNQFTKANKNAAEGVYDIVKAKDKGELALGDEMAGQPPTNKLPETVQEHLQAISQTKANTFAKYDALKREAGEAGALVDITPIAGELRKAALDPVLNDLRPGTAKYLKEQADILQKRGRYTPEQAQTAIATLNKDVESFYKNPSPDQAGKIAVDASIVRHLRKALDDTVEAETGANYQALKNEYGRLTAMEKEAGHRARVAGRAAPASLIDALGGYLGSGELVSGILSMNPALIAKGGTMLAVKNYIKKINSPDTQIKNMYKTADKHYVRPEETPIIKPEPKPQSVPPVQRIREPLNLPVGSVPAMGRQRVPLNKLSDLSEPYFRK